MKWADLDITDEVYQDLENLRRSYLGEEMTHNEAIDFLNACHIPGENARIWELCLKYNILFKSGSTRYARYRVSKDMYSMKTLQNLENEYYNGRKPKKDNTPKVTEKETNRTVLTTEYMIKELRKKNIICFKITPNLLKLGKHLSLDFILSNSDAELL